MAESQQTCFFLRENLTSLLVYQPSQSAAAWGEAGHHS